MNMSGALASSRTSIRPRTALRRAGIIGAATTATLLLFAAPAFAHITVSPDSVPVGSTTELTFHVPNEEANASTVKVDVQIPTLHPIAQLLAKPVPGWVATVKTIKLPKPVTTDDGTFTTAVSEVTWTGGHVEPGQFQDFSISCDSLPDGPGQLVFKAIQTYSNGDVVRWIDVSQPGQPEPAHPAPTVTLTAATAPAGTSTAGHTTASSSSDGMARGLGIAGVVIGLLACVLMLTVLRRDRRLSADAGARTVSPDDSDRVLASAKTAARRDQAPANSKPANSKASARPQSRRR
jgi:periplasmic copper chaperone A